MELSERSNTVTQEQIFVIERFIGLVCYGRFLNSVDSERMRNLEYLLHRTLCLIPPSRSGLKGHIRRTVYYAGWINFQSAKNVCLASPFDWDWIFCNRLFTLFWHLSEVAINAGSLTATCVCSSQKGIKFKCNTFSCIPLCRCQWNCIYKSVYSIFIDTFWFCWFFWCINCL